MPCILIVLPFLLSNWCSGDYFCPSSHLVTYPSFLPGVTCRCSLVRASVTCNSHTRAALPWGRDAPGRQPASQAHHFPASLGVSWRQVAEFFWPWTWEGCILLPDLVYCTHLLCSYLLSPGWLLAPWASQWSPHSAVPPPPAAHIFPSLITDSPISKSELFCVVPLRFGGLILKQLVVF